MSVWFVAAALLQTVGAVQPGAAADPKPPALKMPLREGVRMVAGVVDPKPDSIEVVVVLASQLKVATLAAVLKGQLSGAEYVDFTTTKEIKDDTTFTAVLTMPLVAGERVVVCAVKGSKKACNNEEVTSTGDWGRVRSYFAGGVTFSKDRDNFSKQDLTLSFTLDKSWYEPAVGSWFKGFNTFFDTRLTAVPVNQTTTTQTSSSSSGAGSTPAQSTTDQFLASQKAAIMQGGLYIPFYRDDWTWVHQHARNAIFVAPVMKIGLITTVSNTTSSSTTTTSTTTTTTTNTEAPDTVYKFYALGFALGHEKLSGTRNSSPEVISYVHVTYGRWNNFDPDHWRFGVEGRLKVPESPFQIGFDANVPSSSGKGDLRFLIGARFDLGELIGKLKLLGS